MKKLYLKKNLLSGISAFLCYGWEKEELSFLSCEFHEPYHITSISGDIVYFTYTDCSGLYDDFIVRFGSSVSRETIQDIDIFRVCKKDGRAVWYKLEFTIHLEKRCICNILGELLLGLTFILKEHF